MKKVNALDAQLHLSFIDVFVFSGLFVLLICSVSVAHAISPGQFEDVSVSAGMVHPSESYAACWGDFDGDGAPDLYANNHRAVPTLYSNDGAGRFEDIVPQVWFGEPKDNHGCAWADFDRDGDMDLMDITGGPVERASAFNQFHVNEGTRFEEESVLWNLDYLELRGRAPLWFDYDSDGFLDIALMGYLNNDGRFPSSVFHRESDHFVNTTNEVGFDCPKDSLYATLSDLSADGRPDLICHGFSFPQKVYDISTFPFTDITARVPKQSNAWDTAIADFTGDLLPDIFVAKNPGTSNVEQTEDTVVQAKIKTSRGQVGFDFSSSGQLFVSLYSESLEEGLIYIGSSGWHPAITSRNPLRSEFTISSDDPAVSGLKSHVAGTDQGLYIGYDVASQQWKVRLSGGPDSGTQRAGMYLDSENSVANLNAVGFDPDAGLRRPGYLVNTGDGFLDRSVSSGFTPIKCNTAAAGDYDNDMDVDLYLVCGHVPANRPNRLYENRGDGTFVDVPFAGGAEGSAVGLGQNAAVADVDMDGFLDIFVSNGGNVSDAIPNGTDQLFRNKGNANHWIELDLEGTLSNPHGFGARVIAEAGGVKQLREVGGMHVFTQDFQRVHFGLAANTNVDRLTVYWPSGVVQELIDLPADSIYKITEPSQGPVQGEGCGEPSINSATGPGVFLWQDCPGGIPAGQWHVRVASGDAPTSVTFVGEINTTGVFPYAPTGFSLESNDVLEPSTAGTSSIAFKMRVVHSGIDGFEFLAPTGADTCLAVNLPGNPQVFVGASKRLVGPSVDLGTLEPCNAAPPPPLSSCGEPSIDRSAESGVFLWEDCAGDVRSGQWNVRFTAGGGPKVIYEGQVTAAQSFPSTPTEFSVEGADSVVGSPEAILYILKVAGTGHDGFGFEAPATGETCFGVAAPLAAPVYVGAGKQRAIGSLNLSSLGTCSVAQ